MPQSKTIQTVSNYQLKILILSIISVGRFLSFFRLHFPLNKANCLWGQQCHSYRPYMGGKGGSPHQAELIMIRIFRSSALSQQPTPTPHKITADLHAKTLFTQIFILSAASHKHTTMEKSTKAIQTSLALPLLEDQGLKTQTSCTTTKAPMHKNSLYVFNSLVICFKLPTSNRAKTVWFASD